MKEITLKELELKKDLDKQWDKIFEIFGSAKLNVTITELEDSDDDLIITPFDLRGSINIINKSENNRIIAGYANVAVVDQEEQFIPIETLKKGIECLLKDPHYSNLMLVHKNIQIGKIIPKYEKLTTHVDEKGLFIVAEIRKDIKTADEVWKAILDKDLTGFSIGCEVISSHKKCDDDKCITILDEINIFEVSVCSQPINQESGFIVVSKSKFETLDIEDVCNECINQKINMAENKTKTEEKSDVSEIIEENTSEEKETEIVEEEVEAPTEEAPVEDTPTEEKTVEERLANIERMVAALEEILRAKEEPEEEAPPEDMPPEDEEIPPEEEEEMSEETPEEVPEVDMATFMLEFIMANPKASAQDIAKAWIDKKKGNEPKEEEQELSEESTTKKSFSEILDKLSCIADKLSEKEKMEEIKLSIKARDDQIDALNKKIEILTKSEDTEEKGEPKTVQDESNNTPLEKDNPIRVERGIVYYKE